MGATEHNGQVLITLPSGHREMVLLEEACALEATLGHTIQDMQVTRDWTRARDIAQSAHDQKTVLTTKHNIYDKYFHFAGEMENERWYIRRCAGLYTFEVVLERDSRYRFHRVVVKH